MALEKAESPALLIAEPLHVRQRSTQRTKAELEAAWGTVFDKSAAWLLDGDHLTEKLEKATFSQVAIGLGIAQDKIMALRGEPSVVVGYAERRKMDELLPLLAKELEKRQLTVTATIKPQEVPTAPD